MALGGRSTRQLQDLKIDMALFSETYMKPYMRFYTKL
jgi:hypothetical protein